jgi:predicted sugar kinase
MECFEVRQEQEDRWSVSSKGRTLYFYASEEEARWAALMLASDMCQSGKQASVVITPPELSHFPQGDHTTQQFTGM